MIELTEEQRRELAKPEPVAIDPQTKETYILVRADLYQRLRDLLYDDAEFPIREAYPLMDEVAAKAGWDDPAMDIYNDLAPKQQPCRQGPGDAHA
ncbi:MAG TPA: hypothetical protein VG013_11695 [Gemmataceae bacterium]|nr:hypothetical protein [Gemmataceae bacterium]